MEVLEMSRDMVIRRPSLDEARAMYPYRYTMEHWPNWARRRATNGRWYAPQYMSDKEWYENTVFPGEANHPLGPRCLDCYSAGKTWPLGVWLDEPYNYGRLTRERV